MKNSKGFTMIELIAVFLIIAALSVVGVVTVNAIMAKVEENYYADIEQELLLAGSEYYSDNQRDRPVDSYNKVELGTLINNKYIEKVLDKNGNDTCEGNVYIYKNAAKYDYQACISCGKKSDGTFAYTSEGAYCQNTVKDVIFIDARGDKNEGYSSTLSYENTDWTSANYLNFTFNMNSGVVSKYVITNLSTLETSDCIPTNNVCTKKINTTGSYSVMAYGSEGNVIGSSKYFNAKFDRTAPTFDVTLSSGKFRYGFDEKSYHFSSKIINLKDDNGIKSVKYTLTGTKVIAQNEDITNTLSIDKDLPSGRYTLTVTVTDVAGNVKRFTGSDYIEVIMPIKITYTDIEGNVFDKGYKEVVNGLAYNYSGDFTFGYNTKFPQVEAYFYLDSAKKNRIYNTTLVNTPEPYTIYAFDSYILQAPPTASEYCLNPTYNGNVQVITKAADVGFSFSNNKKTDYSSTGYNVVAKVGDLYMWTTLSRDDITINCNIMPKKVTVTSTNKTYTFDNAEHKSNACTGDGLVTGHSVSCTNSGTITKVGTVTNPISKVVVKDSGGVDVTKNYTITKKSGNLVVNTRPVTVSTGDITCKYSKCGSSEASSAISSTKFSNLVTGWKGTVTTAASEITSFLTNKPVGNYTIYDGMDFVIKDQNGVDITNQCGITYITGKLKIETYSVSVPTALCKSGLVYNSNAQTIASLSGDAATYAKFTNTADISKTNAGSYKVTAQLKDKTNTKWSDGTTTDKTETCTIAKQSVTYTTACANKTYNGNAQSIASYTSDSRLTVTGASQTKAGNYTVTTSLKDKANYQWSDGSTSDKSATCRIAKATPEFTIISSDTVIGTNARKSTATTSVEGSVSVSSSDTGSLGVSVTGGPETKFVVTLSPKNKTATITVTATFTPVDINYNSVTKTITVSAFKLAEVGSCVTGLVYNKNSQKIATDGVGVTVTGNYQTKAGSYNVSYLPQTGYKFSDGGTTAKTVSCSIAKATPSFSVSPVSATVIGMANKSITATAGVKGTLTISNSNSSVVSGATGSVSIDPSFTLVATGKAERGSATFTFKFVPEDTTNYNSVTKTATVTAYKEAKTGSCGSLTYNTSSQTLLSGGVGVTYTNNTRTNAGKQTVTVNAQSDYLFSDGTTSKGMDCEIKKATPTMTLSRSSMELIGSNSGTVTVTTNTNGTLSSSTSNSTAVATGVLSGGTSKFTITIGGWNAVGTSLTVTASFSPTDTTNYVSTSKTISVKTYLLATVGTCNSNLSYNGNNQTIATNGTNTTISNQTQKNAGTYSVSYTPVSGSRFSDGGSTAKTVSCSIAKINPTVSISPGSRIIIGSGSSSFSVSSNLAGSISVSSSSSSISASGSGSISAGGSKSISVSASNVSATSTISAKFTPTDTTNYNSKTVTATVTAYKQASPGSCVANLRYNGSNQTVVTGGTGVTYTTTSFSSVGKHQVTAAANNGYLFSDNTGSKLLECYIEKGLATTGSCKDLTYNGGSRELMSGGSHVTYSNNARTTAGTQTVTITADNNYQFSDGATKQTKDCTIKPATANKASCNSLTYNGSAQTLASGATNATYSNNSRTAAGSQTVTVTANENYAFSDGATKQTLSCSIARAKTANPGSCNSGLVYNGKSQTLMSGGTSVSYSNNTRTAAGSQNVTVTADSNHLLTGGETSTTVSCSIAKKPATIKAASCTLEYDGLSKTCGGCTATGIVDSAVPTFSCSNVVKTSVGSYPVPAGGTISSNYNVTLENGTLKIQDTTKPSCSIAISDKGDGTAGVGLGCSDSAGIKYCGFNSNYSTSTGTSKTISATTTIYGYAMDNNGNKQSCSKKATRSSSTQYRSASCNTATCAGYGNYGSGSTSYATSCSAVAKGGGTTYRTCASQTIYRTKCTPKCVLNGNASVTTKTGSTTYGTWKGSSPGTGGSCSMTCASGSSSTYTSNVESKSGYKVVNYSGGSCTSYSCSTWNGFGSWGSTSCSSVTSASTKAGLKNCESKTVYSWS